MHVLGADLHFDRHAVRSEQRRVQRLVAVDARDRDVVLEAPRHRPVQAVHQAERAIAGVDASRRRCGSRTRRRSTPAARACGASSDRRCRDASRGLRRGPSMPAFSSAPRRLSAILPTNCFWLPRARLQRLLDDAVAARVQRLEAQLLELGLDRVDAEAIGDRRVDLQRLARDGAALGRRHGAERAHVVRAVGELDHDDADVAHHRQQHLAEALGLRLGAAAELDLVELGDAVDQLGDVGAEALGDLVLRGRRVLDDVVQDRRDDRRRIQVQVGEDVGDRDRMGDVRLAAQALLAFVGLGAELVGVADAIDLRRRQVGLELVEQLRDADRASSGRQQTQDGRRVVHDSDGGLSGAAISLPGRGEVRAARRTFPAPASISGCGRSASSRISGPMWPAAISRSATTVDLSFSHSTVASAPLASLRARLAATRTSWNRFGTLCRQSSTVIRAMSKTSTERGIAGWAVYRAERIAQAASCVSHARPARESWSLRISATMRAPLAGTRRSAPPTEFAEIWDEVSTDPAALGLGMSRSWHADAAPKAMPSGARSSPTPATAATACPNYKNAYPELQRAEARRSERGST